jgi:tRNA A37 threonylcarbamoyladenosine dehydratase
MTHTEPEHDERLGGIRRLYGNAAADRIAAASVMVIGVGGVGSWTIEALARTGVGRLILVDLDEVCVTNTNRQVHAISGNYGRPKVEAMRDRVAAIAPGCSVEVIADFFAADTAEAILGLSPDLVIDAIDDAREKALLIHLCRARSLPLIVSGAAGGRKNPAAVTAGDLGATAGDPLLREVRRHLRMAHGWTIADRQPWGVSAVFSQERATYPTPEGEVCDTPASGAPGRLDCRTGFGTSAMVVGAVGLTLAALAADLLAYGAHPTGQPSLDGRSS